MTICLSTARTVMTPIEECDWLLFQRLHTEPDIITHCFDPPSEQALMDKFASRLKTWTPESDHWLCLMIKDSQTKRPIGITGFILQRGVAEVGYLLLPGFYGKQLATETLEPMIHWAHAQHQVQHFSATVTEGNDGSERVLEKCGFTLVNIIPDAYEIAGKRYADKIYSLQIHQCGLSTNAT